MSGAVEAAADDLIVLITNNGAQIVLTDVPVVGWITDETSAVPAVPVIPWALTEPWARIEVETRHLTPGLIGAARVDATMCDNSFRGRFSELLDHLTATTGLAVTGTELVNGTLVSAFWSWVGDKHGGRTFS